MDAVMNDFGIDVTDFGIFAAFYYYGYAGLQIPAALLLDKFPSRIVIAGFITVCAIGLFMFSMFNDFRLAVLSRFLVGAGSAIGFLGTAKVISELFKPELFGRMIGLSFTIGLLGAIFGGKPLGTLTTHFTRQELGNYFGFVCVIIAGSVILFLNSGKKKENDKSFFSIKLLFNKELFLLALAGMLMVGTLEGFADVWGVPYVSLAFQKTKSEAAGLVSLIFFGMLGGGPFLAYLSQKFGTLKIVSLCGLSMALSFSIMLSGIWSGNLTIGSLLFVLGILCCYQVLIFEAGTNILGTQHTSIVVAFLNCVNMLGGSFFHTILGMLIKKIEMLYNPASMI